MSEDKDWKQVRDWKLPEEASATIPANLLMELAMVHLQRVPEASLVQGVQWARLEVAKLLQWSKTAETAHWLDHTLKEFVGMHKPIGGTLYSREAMGVSLTLTVPKQPLQEPWGLTVTSEPVGDPDYQFRKGTPEEGFNEEASSGHWLKKTGGKVLD